MAGIEKITDQIMEEANASAKEIMDAANAKRAAVLKDAEEAARKIRETLDKETEEEVMRLHEKSVSKREQDRKVALLQAKQEFIANVLQKSYERFLAQEETSYFNTLVKVAEKYALKGEGVLIMNEKDKARMPQDFAERVNKAAENKGGSIRISDETRAIEGGFVLVYGGIEENCSFKALFDAKRDVLLDQVHRELFV